MLFKTEYKNKLVKIFVPIMLSNLISQVQMFIDRIFLGRMNILYMSAVGNATAPVWTTMSFVYSLSPVNLIEPPNDPAICYLPSTLTTHRFVSLILLILDSLYVLV